MRGQPILEGPRAALSRQAGNRAKLFPQLRFTGSSTSQSAPEELCVQPDTAVIGILHDPVMCPFALCHGRFSQTSVNLPRDLDRLFYTLSQHIQFGGNRLAHGCGFEVNGVIKNPGDGLRSRFADVWAGIMNIQNIRDAAQRLWVSKVFRPRFETTPGICRQKGIRFVNEMPGKENPYNSGVVGKLVNVGTDKRVNQMGRDRTVLHQVDHMRILIVKGISKQQNVTVLGFSADIITVFVDWFIAVSGNIQIKSLHN